MKPHMTAHSSEPQVFGDDTADADDSAEGVSPHKDGLWDDHFFTAGLEPGWTPLLAKPLRSEGSIWKRAVFAVSGYVLAFMLPSVAVPVAYYPTLFGLTWSNVPAQFAYWILVVVSYVGAVVATLFLLEELRCRRAYGQLGKRVVSGVTGVAVLLTVLMVFYLPWVFAGSQNIHNHGFADSVSLDEAISDRAIRDIQRGDYSACTEMLWAKITSDLPVAGYDRAFVAVCQFRGAWSGKKEWVIPEGIALHGAGGWVMLADIPASERAQWEGEFDLRFLMDGTSEDIFSSEAPPKELLDAIKKVDDIA